MLGLPFIHWFIFGLKNKQRWKQLAHTFLTFDWSAIPPYTLAPILRRIWRYLEQHSFAAELQDNKCWLGITIYNYFIDQTRTGGVLGAVPSAAV